MSGFRPEPLSESCAREARELRCLSGCELLPFAPFFERGIHECTAA